jgi:hypothetical protein
MLNSFMDLIVFYFCYLSSFAKIILYGLLKINYLSKVILPVLFTNSWCFLSKILRYINYFYKNLI